MNNFQKIQNFRQISDLFSQIWLKKRHTSLFSGNWREIRKKIHQKFEVKIQNSIFFSIEPMKFINSIAKQIWRFLTKKLRLENGAKEVASGARCFACARCGPRRYPVPRRGSFVLPSRPCRRVAFRWTGVCKPHQACAFLWNSRHGCRVLHDWHFLASWRTWWRRHLAKLFTLFVFLFFSASLRTIRLRLFG